MRPNPKSSIISLFILVTFMVASVWAQQDSGSSKAKDDLDDFFDNDASIVVPADKSEVKQEYSESFIKEEALRLGGNFNFNVDINATYAKDPTFWDYEYLSKGAGEASKVTLDGSLFFMARPSSAVRYYGKAKIGYPFYTFATQASDVTAMTDNNPATIPGTGIPVPSIKIWELYADFDVEDKVFLRAGKQMTKWGVGYFFQPADVISLSAVDPASPEAEREGPVAVKANVPLDVHNLDAYVIAPETLASAKDLAYALRLSFVVANFEFGLGGRYQFIPDNKLGSSMQGIATISGSLWKFALFGEAIVKYGTSKRYVVKDAAVSYGGTPPASLLNGYRVEERRYDPFFSGSAGFRFSDNQDLYLTVIGQYFYNGEGYAGDTKDIAVPALMFLSQGKLSMADISSVGRHYAAAMATYSFVNDSKVSVSTFWMGNLIDASGFVKPSVAIKVTDEIKIGLYAQMNYGETNSEFRGTSLVQLPRMKAGFTVDLASGNF